MNPSLQALVETLLWSETDSEGCFLDRDFTEQDVDAASLSELHKRFQAFLSKAETEVTALKGSNWSSIEDFYTGSGLSAFQLERDYVFTVNGHGCGFWEKDDWEPEVSKLLTRLAKAETPIHCVVDNGKVFMEFL